MDDLITFYIQTAYPPAAQEDIFQTLGLFQVFNYLDPYPKFQELLSQESYLDTNTLADSFTSIILVGQQYLLDRHCIRLNDQTTLEINNKFLRVLFQLQKLDSPEPVLTILETTHGRVQKFAMIMDLLSDMSEAEALMYIDEVRPNCLDLLGEFLYQQESNETVVRGHIPAIKSSVELFTKVFGINQAVRIIIESDIVMGEKFELYRPLFDELRESVSDENVLLETLLFLLLYSSDGNLSPMETFEVHSDYIVSDLTTGNRLGNTLAAMITKMQRHKEKEEHEKG